MIQFIVPLGKLALDSSADTHLAALKVDINK